MARFTPQRVHPHPTVARDFSSAEYIYTFSFVERLSSRHVDRLRRPAVRHRRLLLVARLHTLVCNLAGKVLRAVPHERLREIHLREPAAGTRDPWLMVLDVREEPPLVIAHGYDLRNRGTDLRGIVRSLLGCRWVEMGSCADVPVRDIPQDVDAFDIVRQLRTSGEVAEDAASEGSQEAADRDLQYYTAHELGSREVPTPVVSVPTRRRRHEDAAPRAARQPQTRSPALHAGEWRGHERPQWCSTWAAEDGELCKHGTTTIREPHWSCCGADEPDGCTGVEKPAGLGSRKSRPAPILKPKVAEEVGDVVLPGGGPVVVDGGRTAGTLYATEAGGRAGSVDTEGGSDMPPVRDRSVPADVSPRTNRLLPPPEDPADLADPPEQPPDATAAGLPDAGNRRRPRWQRVARAYDHASVPLPPQRQPKTLPQEECFAAVTAASIPIAVADHSLSRNDPVTHDAFSSALPGPEEVLAEATNPETRASLYRTRRTGAWGAGLVGSPERDAGFDGSLTESSTGSVHAGAGEWAAEQARRATAHRPAFPTPPVRPSEPAPVDSEPFELKVRRHADDCLREYLGSIPPPLEKGTVCRAQHAGGRQGRFAVGACGKDVCCLLSLATGEHYQVPVKEVRQAGLVSAPDRLKGEPVTLLIVGSTAQWMLEMSVSAAERWLTVITNRNPVLRAGVGGDRQQLR